MKRLIKRYVLKAQVDKENDEVNEGELKCYSFEKSQVMIILRLFLTECCCKCQMPATVKS